jgi:hypothetical protein
VSQYLFPTKQLNETPYNNICQVTTWRRDLPEKLIVAQVIYKVSNIYGTRKLHYLAHNSPVHTANPISLRYSSIQPVSIAERSKACTVYDSLNIEIAGSDPARGMDVCLRVSVLGCPVFR